ncbi:MAG: hypothetical protein U1E64_05700 [Sphingomonadaceae bacterium]
MSGSNAIFLAIILAIAAVHKVAAQERLATGGCAIDGNGVARRPDAGAFRCGP